MGNNAVKVSSARMCATDGRTDFFIFGKLAGSEFFENALKRYAHKNGRMYANQSVNIAIYLKMMTGLSPPLFFAKQL